MGSSAVPMMATGPPTGTVVPSGARILRSTPETCGSTSMLTLSVITSNSVSQPSTGSPSALYHLRIVPSCMVWPSIGSLNNVAIGFPRR